MKIKTKSKKPLVILSLVVLIGAGAFLAYYFTYGSGAHDNSAKLDASSNSLEPTRSDSDEEQASQLQENPDNKNSSPNTDQPSTPTEDPTANKTVVPMTASADTSNDTVYIRGGANYPVQGGSCYALLKGPANQSIRKDTSVLQNPASTDCKTIPIPINELVSGQWTFTLHYSSETYEGVSDEVEFSF